MLDAMSSQGATCVFHGVGKTYRTLIRRRAVRAVEGFSLEIPTGEVFGIAGPNGAGKSTLINLLLGFVGPTLGTVSINGERPRVFIESRGVGYLSELVAIPPGWTVDGALRRYALLARIRRPERRTRIDAAVVQLGLEEHRGKKVRQLSKGNLQRLGLAQALMSDSDLVVLDEPTHGFDPVWTARFRDIGRSLKRPGRTVIIASHNLDELERVADRVGIIDQGRLQHVAEMGRSSSATLADYRLVVQETEPTVPGVFPAALRVADGRVGEYRVPQVDLATLNEGLRRLLAGGTRLVAVVPIHSQLESTFREVVRERP